MHDAHIVQNKLVTQFSKSGEGLNRVYDWIADVDGDQFHSLQAKNLNIWMKL